VIHGVAPFLRRCDIHAQVGDDRLLPFEFLERYGPEGAFLALFAITGQEHGYDPEASPEARKQAIERWRKHLEGER